MINFYKILLKKSKPKTVDGHTMMECNFDDIEEGFKEAGYHHYRFGGFQDVYTKHELSKEEQERMENEAQEGLQAAVDNISKEINKRILEDIKMQVEDLCK